MATDGDDAMLGLGGIGGDTSGDDGPPGLCPPRDGAVTPPPPPLGRGVGVGGRAAATPPSCTPPPPCAPKVRDEWRTRSRSSWRAARAA